MDLAHCIRESELIQHTDLFEFPLDCGKEEWNRQLHECFSSSRGLLQHRASQVQTLRKNPEILQKGWKILSDLRKSEEKLLSHTTNSTSKTAEEQIFFTGPHTTCLNHVPFLLTFFVFMKIYIAPIMGLLTPILIFLTPYILMNTVMGAPIPWDMYVPMMKQMMFGISEGQQWGLKQYSQVLWTLVSLGQGMVMPFVTAYHTNKLDKDIVARGEAIQDLCRRGRQVYDSYKSIGALGTVHLTIPEPPSDPREAVAWMTHEKLVLKTVKKVLGQLTVLTCLARDPLWQPVRWGSASLEFTELADLAIDPSVAITSDLSLSTHSLLTGPNRGGKSSSLRAILQQVLLGQTFGMTYSAIGSWTPFRLLFTRLKSKDHAGKESLFEMEVRMASTMLHTTAKSGQPTLLLIDELFHSTNPPDAEISAKLFLQRLWTLPNAKSMISTHIFSLCETPGHEGIQTFCCAAEEREDESIQYSYRLTEGICQVSSVREVLHEAGLVQFRA